MTRSNYLGMPDRRAGTPPSGTPIPKLAAHLAIMANGVAPIPIAGALPRRLQGHRLLGQKQAAEPR